MAATTVETTGANGQRVIVRVSGEQNVTIEKTEGHMERTIQDKFMMTVRPQKRNIEDEEIY